MKTNTYQEISVKEAADISWTFWIIGYGGSFLKGRHFQPVSHMEIAMDGEYVDQVLSNGYASEDMKQRTH